MDTVQLGHEDVQERFRLSCQTRVTSDARILVAPPKSEVGHKLMSLEGGRAGESRAAMELDSGVTKRLIQVELPDDENHQTSDDEEVLRQLPDSLSPIMPPNVLRQLPAALRDKFGEVTVTSFLDEIIDVEAGDTTAHKYGMAFDIGTTSVVGALIDLETGVELATVGGLNPAVALRRGPDVPDRLCPGRAQAAADAAGQDSRGDQRLHQGSLQAGGCGAAPCPTRSSWSATPACTTSSSASTRPMSGLPPTPPRCAARSCFPGTSCCSRPRPPRVSACCRSSPASSARIRSPRPWRRASTRARNTAPWWISAPTARWSWAGRAS